MAQEQTPVPGINEVTQANINVIIAKYKTTGILRKLDTVRNMVGSLAGVDVSMLNNLYNGTVGKVIEKVFGKKQIWSGLTNQEKEDLIQGLILQAVWIKEIFDVQAVKNSVVNALQSTKPQIVQSNNTTFYGANPWIVNRIDSEVKKAKELISLIQRIQASFSNEIAVFEQKQTIALAYQAYQKAKAGQTISKTEANALVSGVAIIKAINLAKQRKGMDNNKPPVKQL